MNTFSRFLRFCLLLAGSAVLGRAAELAARDGGELAAALRQAQAGDSIVLRDGEWRDTQIVFVARGEPGRPVTLRGQTPGGVVLTGRSSLRLGGPHLVVSGLRFERIDGGDTIVEYRAGPGREATDSRVTDCTIVDCNPPDRKTNTKWVSLYGQRNRLDHCSIAGKTNLGTTVVVWLAETPNEHRIDHNHFGPRPPLGENGGETIRIGTSDWSMRVSRTVVEENLFERCNGEVEVVSNKSCENVYRGNTFVECEGALTLRHGNRCVVDGNFFLGRGKRHTGGVRVIGEDHVVTNNYFCELMGDGSRSALSVMQGMPNSPLAGYFQVKRARIAFNTFVHCANPLAIGLPGARTTLPPEGCELAANVVLSRGGGYVQVTGAAEGVTWRDNVFFGGAPGASVPATSRVVDPRLTVAADGLWRPAAESPLRGAAGEGAVPDHDIDGRPRSGRRDIGCDQIDNGTPLRRPMTVATAGPSWRR